MFLKSLWRGTTPGPTTHSYANRDFPVHCEIPRTGGDSCSHFVSEVLIKFQRPFRRLCLWPAISRFPTAETGVGGDSVRMLGQCEGRRSNSCCRDHSGGKSVR